MILAEGRERSCLKREVTYLYKACTSKIHQLPVMLMVDLPASQKRKVTIKSLILYSVWGKSLLILSCSIWGKGHVSHA
jgi:hypothetical protein